MAASESRSNASEPVASGSTMMPCFSVGMALFAAGAIVAASPALAPSAAAACEAASPSVGPQVRIDGAPRFSWPARGTLIVDICSNGSDRRFKGIDIAVPEGAPAKAAAGGVVVYAGDDLKDFGNVVIIRHAGNWVTIYGYAGSLLVKRGDTVRQGQAIAIVGRKFATNTPALHFEVRSASSPVDPLRLLPRS